MKTRNTFRFLLLVLLAASVLMTGVQPVVAQPAMQDDLPPRPAQQSNYEMVIGGVLLLLIILLGVARFSKHK